MNWYKIFKISQIEEQQNVITTIDVKERIAPMIEKKFAPLQRKAIRLGLPPVQIIRAGTFAVKTHTPEGELPRYVKYVKLNFVGELPKVPGWDFVARVLHYRDPQDQTKWKNIINGVPGQEVPVVYRTTPPICEHCGQNRNRIDTFIVKNTETGEYKQIGSSCLQDFVRNTNAREYALYISNLYDFIGSVENQEDEEESDHYNGGGGQYEISTQDLLAFTLATVNQVGFFSNKVAEENESTSTSSFVTSRFFNSSGYEEWKRGWRNTPYAGIEESGEDKDKANQIREWMLSQDFSNNDFLYKVQTAIGLETIPYRLISIAIWAIPIYKRAMEEQVERQKEVKKASEWVGQPGDKILFEATFMGENSFEGNYGITYILRFADNNGNKYTWFSSNPFDTNEVGGKILLFGTIKKNDEYIPPKYRNLPDKEKYAEKINVLTRCSNVLPKEIKKRKKQANIDFVNDELAKEYLAKDKTESIESVNDEPKAIW